MQVQGLAVSHARLQSEITTQIAGLLPQDDLYV